MHLFAIGKLRGGPEAELFDRYNVRLHPRLIVVEVREERGTAEVARRNEAVALLGVLPKGAFAVALDLGGDALDSATFAERFAQWSSLSRPLCFLIGGTEGLHPSVISRADHVLSLGRMTWPHFLIRPMLAEQLYRAQTILQGHPYHRAYRPLA